MRVIVDSYAWIEYLRGSEKGEKVRKLLSENNDIYTLNLMISEVVSKVERESENSDIAYNAIIFNSKIFNLTPEISKDAGIFHAQRKKKVRNFGLVDAILFSVAKKLNAKIITGDEHFKTFKETIFL